jgi:hypothetical protein
MGNIVINKLEASWSVDVILTNSSKSAPLFVVTKCGSSVIVAGLNTIAKLISRRSSPIRSKRGGPIRSSNSAP